jgi:DNA-binding helix-hairpin-helix protein with protein kinase domain
MMHTTAQVEISIPYTASWCKPKAMFCIAAEYQQYNMIYHNNHSLLPSLAHTAAGLQPCCAQVHHHHQVHLLWLYMCLLQ